MSKIEIELPNISAQRMIVLEEETKKAISLLNSNLLGNKFPKVNGLDYSKIDFRIFVTVKEGWISPPAEVIDAWFSQVKSIFPEYGTDEKLGNLLGIQGKGVDRRIRAYRNGNEAIPYGIWRSFLVLTGRAVPEIKPVLGIFDIE